MKSRFHHTVSLLALLSIALGVTSCSRKAAVAPLPPEAVARVGGTCITAGQVQQRMSELAKRRPGTPVTPDDREAALEELVQFEALYARARHAGWDTNADLVAAFRRSVVARFRESEVSRASAERPDDGEIAAYYQSHIAEFTTPARVRGAVLLLDLPGKATAERRAQAGAEALRIRDEALRDPEGPAHFGTLAQRLSADQATRYHGGDFGSLTRAEIEGRYGAAVAQALENLTLPGDISPVVETPRGLVLVKLIGRSPPAARALAEVREGIRHQVARTRQARAEREVQEAARRDADVTIDRALLDSVPLPQPPSTPPSLAALPSRQPQIPYAAPKSN